VCLVGAGRGGRPESEMPFKVLGVAAAYSIRLITPKSSVSYERTRVVTETALSYRINSISLEPQHNM